MRLPALSVGGWTIAACLVGSVLWSCSSDETDPFSNPSRGGTGGADTGGGGSSGANTGGTTSGSTSGGSSGSNSGGDSTGGTPTGGTTGDGGAGADTGGTATGGTSGVTGGAGASGATAGDGGKGGSAGTPAGGAGMGGAGTGGVGIAGGGAGAGNAGSGGMPGNCGDDDDCDADEYCKKASCNAASGTCTPRGPECRGATAAFEPVCGCDGITYWNTCVIEHEGFNFAMKGECTGNDRPTCSRIRRWRLVSPAQPRALLPPGRRVRRCFAFDGRVLGASDRVPAERSADPALLWWDGGFRALHRALRSDRGRKLVLPRLHPVRLRVGYAQ